jgi:NAD(P)-dependent dehydrogenase (short-subunit alcohol dehydrogenase family)
MDVAGQAVVITGGAGGLGQSLARAVIARGPAAVVLADIDADALAAARATFGDAVRTVVADIGTEAGVGTAVDACRDLAGRVDIYFSNAGIIAAVDPFTSDDVWQREWQVHQMSHVYAARSLLPEWLERGSGYLVITASGAGMLPMIGDDAYMATKSAAIATGEVLALRYRPAGVRVSIVCPNAMRTPMAQRFGEAGSVVDWQPGLADPDVTAESILDAMETETLIIYPHSGLQDSYIRKAQDHDRWERAARRVHDRRHD